MARSWCQPGTPLQASVSTYVGERSDSLTAFYRMFDRFGNTLMTSREHPSQVVVRV